VNCRDAALNISTSRRQCACGVRRRSIDYPSDRFHEPRPHNPTQDYGAPGSRSHLHHPQASPPPSGTPRRRWVHWPPSRRPHHTPESPGEPRTASIWIQSSRLGQPLNCAKLNNKSNPRARPLYLLIKQRPPSSRRRTPSLITMSGDSDVTMYEHPLVKRYATKVRPSLCSSTTARSVCLSACPCLYR